MTELNVANLFSADSPESGAQPGVSALVQDWRSLTVAEVMDVGVVWALADVTIAELLQQMVTAAARCIVVVEAVWQEEHSAREPEQLRPIGIVTETDLLQSYAKGFDCEQTLAQMVMATGQVSVCGSDRLEDAIQLMLQSQQQQVVVTTETGELAGILTQAEILRSLAVAIEQRRSEAVPEAVLPVPLASANYRVLVVDDELEHRQLLVQWLTALGVEVQAVAGGQMAIAMWQQWQPHLVLLDLEMPDMDGYRVMRLMRSHQADWQDQELGQWAKGELMQGELMQREPMQREPTQKTGGLRIIGLVEAERSIEAVHLFYSSFVDGCDDVLIKPLQADDLSAKLARFHTNSSLD